MNNEKENIYVNQDEFEDDEFIFQSAQNDQNDQNAIVINDDIIPESSNTEKIQQKQPEEEILNNDLENQLNQIENNETTNEQKKEKKHKSKHHHSKQKEENKQNKENDNEEEDKQNEKKKKQSKTNKKEEKKENEEQPEVEMLTFAEYSENVNAVITPVGITLLLTIIMTTILHKSTSYFSQTSYVISSQLESSDSIPAWLIAVIVSAVFIFMIVIVTFIFVILFYFKCMKIIVGWLMLSIVLLLMFFGGLISMNLLEVVNWPVDWLSFAFVIFNFGILGVVSVFYLTPMKLNQFYMIIISVFMAVVFSNFPEWTTWMLLVGMAIYDLVAVLCPKGPLKMLVNLSEERNEPIPALLYSTAIWLGMVSPDDENATDHIINVKENPFTLSKRHGRGIKLGLGDFVFYSVLVGRCCMYDLTTVFTACIAVLSGLFGTLILLVVFNKALPALPISIFLGVIVYVVGRWCLVPLITSANLEGITV